MTDELRRLAEQATPGPWIIGIDRVWSRALPEGEDTVVPAYAKTSADTVFIAAANPTAILALLDRAEKAEARLERIRADAAESIGSAEMGDNEWYLARRILAILDGTEGS